MENDEEQLDRQALQELLSETKRAKLRADLSGAYGWKKCPLPSANKRFINSTVLNTLRCRREVSNRGVKREHSLISDDSAVVDRRSHKMESQPCRSDFLAFSGHRERTDERKRRRASRKMRVDDEVDSGWDAQERRKSPRSDQLSDRHIDSPRSERHTSPKADSLASVTSHCTAIQERQHSEGDSCPPQKCKHDSQRHKHHHSKHQCHHSKHKHHHSKHKHHKHKHHHKSHTHKHHDGDM